MFANPERIIAQLGLLSNMKVADLGCGTGLYSLAAAHRVTNGHVYAVEVQKGLLGRVKDEAYKKHLSNLEYIWGDIEAIGGTKLTDKSIDVVIVSNVLFQVEHKDGLINEIKRIIKPGGKVLLVDWSDSFGSMGPAKNSVITKDQAITLFKHKGFEKLSDVDAGAHHYGIIFTYKV